MIFVTNLKKKVPPIIIQMAKNQTACSKHDLSSVQSIFTGAAPLGAETADELHKIYPSWNIRQGYGMIHTKVPAIDLLTLL